MSRAESKYLCECFRGCDVAAATLERKIHLVCLSGKTILPGDRGCLEKANGTEDSPPTCCWCVANLVPSVSLSLPYLSLPECVCVRACRRTMKDTSGILWFFPSLAPALTLPRSHALSFFSTHLRRISFSLEKSKVPAMNNKKKTASSACRDARRLTRRPYSPSLTSRR